MCSTGSNFLLSPKQEKSLAACGPDLFCHFAHKMLGLGLGGKASQPNFQTPDREWKCLQSSYAALPYPLYNTVSWIGGFTSHVELCKSGYLATWKFGGINVSAKHPASLKKLAEV